MEVFRPSIQRNRRIENREKRGAQYSNYPKREIPKHAGENMSIRSWRESGPLIWGEEVASLDIGKKEKKKGVALGVQQNVNKMLFSRKMLAMFRTTINNLMHVVLLQETP
jgi:hypothetical protein